MSLQPASLIFFAAEDGETLLDTFRVVCPLHSSNSATPLWSVSSDVAQPNYLLWHLLRVATAGEDPGDNADRLTKSIDPIHVDPNDENNLPGLSKSLLQKVIDNASGVSDWLTQLDRRMRTWSRDAEARLFVYAETPADRQAAEQNHQPLRARRFNTGGGVGRRALPIDHPRSLGTSLRPRD